MIGTAILTTWLQLVAQWLLTDLPMDKRQFVHWLFVLFSKNALE
jgi:hypothetical protein